MYQIEANMHTLPMAMISYGLIERKKVKNVHMTHAHDKKISPKRFGCCVAERETCSII